jgi:cobalt-zinc-cadmium efflux system protein
MNDLHAGENRHILHQDRSLKITLGMVLLVMLVEAIGGIVSNSLALLSDAGHMLTDALALTLSLFALTIARRPATLTRTFGYFRAEIIAALANGSILILVSFYIFYRAYQRFWEAPEVRTPVMLAVAVIGLIVNIGSILLLRSASHRSLNIRAAFWHVIGDTISSVGVVAAGIVIYYTGWYVADPIVAVVIGVIILFGAVHVVREAADILLEAAPRHIDVNKVVESIKKVEGVNDLHDIHVWTITSGMYALSAHLSIDDRMISRSADILTRVNDSLATNFDIRHTTLQLECDSCPTGLVCSLGSPNAHTEAKQ